MTPRIVEPPDPRLVDHCVLLRGVSWREYLALDAARGETTAPRLTYLHGELEIMSPSWLHESAAYMIGRLVDAFAEEMGIELVGVGSWTIRRTRRRAGLEPDRCYVLGTRRPDVPDLAIEVVWTRRLLDKLEVYRGLVVPEVWVWEGGRLRVNVLRGGKYARARRSKLLPSLDLRLLESFVARADQTQAVREYRAALRRRPR